MSSKAGGDGRARRPDSPTVSDGFQGRLHPLVTQAAALFQRGQLAEAEALTRGVLSSAPRDHSALHMLGMIARQKGSRAQAIDLIQQAITINGRTAAYHGNLGNLYLEARQFREAARSFRQALRLEPGSALARFGLGLALLGQREYRAAAQELEAAVKARPDHGDTHLNLGIALTQLGRINEAIIHYRRAIALNPRYAWGHLRLGMALRAKSELQEAHAQTERAIQLDPRLAEAHLELGIVCRALGRSEEAVRPLRTAVELRLNGIETLVHLGGALYDLERFEEAIGCYEQALALAPQSAPLYRAIGRARFLQQRFEEARAAFGRALELEPENGENYAKIGRTYGAEGRFEEAIAWHEKAIMRQSDNAEAHYSLAMLHRAENREGRIDETKRALAAGSLDTDQRATLNFALAKILEEDGDFDAAFSCFRAGNDLRTGTDRYRSDEFSASVDRKIATFSKELFAEKALIGSASQGLVFVVGMPRSGTTLVEQILASHPQIYGHGELTYFDHLSRSLAERLGSREPYPQCVTALDAPAVRDIAQEHMAKLQRDGAGAPWNVDKLPQNFANLGLIALIFPRARVIHCTRDPLDTCLSCYCQDFGPRHAFTRNLEDLSRYFHDYQRLMTHWYATLPIPLLNVPYEELVAAQDVWSRELIDFLELPWDERCLRFYETKRPVLTASVWQVRQPIYSSSIGRWRHYAAHLGPLFRGLGIAPPLG